MLPGRLVFAGMTLLFCAGALHRNTAAAFLRFLGWLRSPVPLILLALFLACFVLRENRYTGDWIPYGYRVPMGPDWLLWQSKYWLAPLSHIFMYLQWRLVDPLVVTEFALATQVLMCLWGTALVAVVWLISRRLNGGRRGAALFTLLYVSAGIVFFSLGRLESYPVSMTILAVAALISLRAIQRKRGAAWAALAMGAAAMAHPQCIAFVPSLIIILIACREEAPWRRLVLRTALALAAFPLLIYMLSLVLDIRGGTREMATGSYGQVVLPPAMVFTFYRASQLGQIFLRLFPAVPFLLLAPILWRKRLHLNDPIAAWFFLNGVMGCLYSLFIWNKAPLFRDWDLIGPSLLMIWLAAMVILFRAAPPLYRTRIALLLVCAQIFHTTLLIAWYKTPDPEQQPTIRVLTEQVYSTRQGWLPRETDPSKSD